MGKMGLGKQAFFTTRHWTRYRLPALLVGISLVLAGRDCPGRPATIGRSLLLPDQGPEPSTAGAGSVRMLFMGER